MFEYYAELVNLNQFYFQFEISCCCAVAGDGLLSVIYDRCEIALLSSDDNLTCRKHV